MTVTELPGIPALGGLYARSLKAFAGRRPDGLPERRIEVADVEVDPDDVAAYARVCGFGLANAVPPTWPHVLAFPLSIHLMTGDDFPFALPGLVHVAQRIEQRAPVRVGDRLDLRVWVDDLRPHRRGRQFDVVAEVARDGQTLWTGTSTYLRRGEGADDDASAAAAGDVDPVDPQRAPTATWRLPKDLGRRYGRVSGDRNPIHLSPLTSRLGGFPRPIAHGMWTAARCLAAHADRFRGPVDLAVAFKQPVPLPSTVTFRTRRDFARATFSLHDRSGRRLHLTGTLDAPEDLL
jgi:acyl dehydratase